MAQILLVDDEASMRRVLAAILGEDGHVPVEAAGVTEARRLLETRPFDLVITDQKMPDGEGLSLVAAAREADPALPVVIVTAFATVELAVAALKEGAFDFITKPFVAETVRAVVRRASERSALVRENENLKGAVRHLRVGTELVGESPAMRRVREMIARVGPTGATVLITGETGVGKELVARALHEVSPRALQPFVPVNCAAFTETLLESELFGHERGAFTGADRPRQGLFEAAHRGTLFLDEVGEMAPATQARLLRVLMDGEVVRVGTTVPRKVDVRLLVATHRDLSGRVREGLFREDLYYRIAVVPLAVPPLRERLEDLPLLVDRLLARVALALKAPARRISPAALETLSKYDFPGNVRELRNVVERACILASGPELQPADFPMALGAPGRGGVPSHAGPEAWLSSLPTSVDLRRMLDEVEKGLIGRALESAGGVQAEAARRLGISRSDIAYKIRKHGLEPHPPE
jgi:two-component system response regulator HydG